MYDTNNLLSTNLADTYRQIKVEVHMEIEPDTEVAPQINHFNPFTGDGHAFGGDTSIFEVVDERLSYDEAWSAVENGTATTDKLYTCTHCLSTFQDPKRYLIHYKWHEMASDHVQRPKDQCVTERKDAQEGKFFCNECDKDFRSMTALKLHRVSEHTRKQCSVCNAVFLSTKELREHTVVHKTDDGYPCDVCHKTFKRQQRLVSHLAVHMEKTESCPECDKKFSTKPLLDKHFTRQHATQADQYKCQYCDKGFKMQDSLIAHERMHTNERPFVCKLCNGSYTAKTYLTRHMRVSHNEKNEMFCKLCHRSFKNQLALQKHEVLNHAKEADYRHLCTICDEKFLKSAELKTHMQTEHPQRKRQRKSDDMMNISNPL